MLSQSFWNGKKVLITGHTGFKGSWLILWLNALGAKITGYSLQAVKGPNLFDLARVGDLCSSVFADIRDQSALLRTIQEAEPEVIIHMAAQPLVRYSYANPVETFEVNTLGTVYLLNAVRIAKASGVNIRAVLNITTDKCYENREWAWGYRENDRLGGYDPYSNSKACAELVTSAFRTSYFHPGRYDNHRLSLATARAGNVIGGGDWSEDRIMPDCIRALLTGSRLSIRHPTANRPWQYVLEPLQGYMLLAQKMVEQGAEYARAWNFGPNDENVKDVKWLVTTLGTLWGETSFYHIASDDAAVHEASSLRLDSSSAKRDLGWQPKWHVEQALARTVEWFKAYERQDDMRSISLKQIEAYEATGAL